MIDKECNKRNDSRDSMYVGEKKDLSFAGMRRYEKKIFNIVARLNCICGEEENKKMNT